MARRRERGPGWWEEARRHREAAIKGWDGRRRSPGTGARSEYRYCERCGAERRISAMKRLPSGVWICSDPGCSPGVKATHKRERG